MKRSIINISLFAAGILALSSCGNEDVFFEAPVSEISESDGETRNSGSALEAKTYSQESLLLTYNGAPLLGKVASFSLVDSGKATIELAGEVLDLNSFIGGSDAMLSEVNTCGVFPGSPVSVLEVELSGSESDCKFSGSSETDFCTFSYEGSVNDDQMVLNLYNVMLKDTTMAQASESLVGGWGFKPFDDNFYNDLRVVWESEKEIELFEGFGMPIGAIVSMALVMPIVDGLTVPALLTGSLNEIRFREDGNIVASYRDSETGEFVDSPINIAQYVVVGDKIILYLNPQAIIANELQKDLTRSDEEPDFSGIDNAVNAIFAAVIPMASQGIPLSYGKAISSVDDFTNEPEYFDYPEMMSIYLGTETLKPLLDAIAPVLDNEEIKQAVIEAATSAPGFESMAPMVEVILNSLDEVIETTSVIELGINVERRSNSYVPMVTI